MVRAWILFFFRVCYAVFENDRDAVFENDRDGPLGVIGMFGEKTEYLDGSIGYEIETTVGIQGGNLKSGVAYATASIDDSPIWMLQVDKVEGDCGVLKLVSHVMDAGDTPRLLILEYSMNKLLQQFSYAKGRKILLENAVKNFNNIVGRTNDDPDWKFMKMPTLHLTNAANGIDASLFAGNDGQGASDFRQINFGVPVDTFTPSRYSDFKVKHWISDSLNSLSLGYMTLAVDKADEWAKAYMERGNAFTPDDQGVLALILAKTLAKKPRFFPRNAITENENHIRMLGRTEYLEYKRTLSMVPKVSLRKLLQEVRTACLNVMLLDDPFLVEQEKTQPVFVADIRRFMSRNLIAASVDDDCFIDVNRVFLPQHHSDGRLAIVMETQPTRRYSVNMNGLEAETVRLFQIYYGDLRVPSDLRPFLNFEVSIAITNLPEYRRVTLDFERVDTDVIRNHVVPLAKDTQFLPLLRSVVGIHQINFMNDGDMFAISGDVLSINGKLAPIYKHKDLKSYVAEKSPLKMKAGFMQISKQARKYNVGMPTNIHRRHLDFGTLLSLKSQFVENSIQHLHRGMTVQPGLMFTSIEDMWERFNMEIFGRNSREPGFLVDVSPETPLDDDIRLALNMWLDADCDMNTLTKYHGHDNVMMKKFDLLRSKMGSTREYCSIS